MKTITLKIPDNLNEDEVVMILAVKLYEEGKLTSGQAASLVNMEKREFLEILGEYGVSIFNTSPDDLSKDFENAGKF